MSCQHTIMDVKPPSRLVYVANDNNHVRLCLTKDIATKGSKVEYTTLTHCWGKTPMPVLTTQQNVSQMLSSIPSESLTKTFRDAILITRRLGYQYLWIDSLCIVQGDDKDWAHESAIMGSIYAGCVLSIVAAAGEDGSLGCLFSRSAVMNHVVKAYAQDEENLEKCLWELSCRHEEHRFHKSSSL